MKIVFDLGAWQGDTTKKLAEQYDIVIAVEPVIENYKVLIKNIPDNVIPLCVAITDKTGMSDIYLDKKSVSDTLIKGRKRSSDLRKVLTIKWDDLVGMLDIKEVEYAWVNIEGSEEMFLEGMTKVFPNKMIIQEHSRKGKTNLNNLEKLLEEKGYKITRRDKIEYYVEYEKKI